MRSRAGPRRDEARRIQANRGAMGERRRSGVEVRNRGVESPSQSPGLGSSQGARERSRVQLLRMKVSKSGAEMAGRRAGVGCSLAECARGITGQDGWRSLDKSPPTLFGVGIESGLHSGAHGGELKGGNRSLCRRRRKVGRSGMQDRRRRQGREEEKGRKSNDGDTNCRDEWARKRSSLDWSSYQSGKPRANVNRGRGMRCSGTVRIADTLLMW